MYTDGIIFDVDGTLWDSTPIVAEAWTQAVLECGIKDRIVTAGELKQLFGKTMSVIAASLFPEASKEVQETILEKCCVYEEEALEENQQDICYPDVREVIKQLAKTYDLYIVSNWLIQGADSCVCGDGWRRSPKRKCYRGAQDSAPFPRWQCDSSHQEIQ